ncbi:cellulase family glycosylhydrolase [Arundinibacter roseus]|uniref:1,4-beta-xylanase n=1 Tax=Arundinibacter roseus TaxID=2070510 RepID=A0A4R4KBH9_9BACT|nr:cellulase family glycosylhydrolase [Arundinibacter roseus]TDB65150.1 1,4-beta-xylanase [Arundinibacter roseus]
MKKLFSILFIFCFSFVSAQQSPNTRWTEAQADAWYAKQPWLFGSNYNPASAINQLEMFQEDTFSPEEIDKELGWAEDMGVNTARVYLHDLLWADSEGFKNRLNQFLDICAKHNIRPVLVLFDSCWDPHPKSGPQRAPQPGIHNSGWLQSPGASALNDPSQHPRLEAYVTGVVGAFANDSRILMWDVWNEPDNTNDNSYGKNHLKQEPENKREKVAMLLPRVFAWARAAQPSQPLTSGLWIFNKNRDMSIPENWSTTEKIQVENSDILTFHHYSDAESFEGVIKQLQTLKRPMICTEFMARGANSLFQTHLPIARKYNVGMINWGFVAGKTQTYLPWDSWQKPYINGRVPKIWFHEILKTDGTPIDPAEIAAIKAATGKTK